MTFQSLCGDEYVVKRLCPRPPDPVIVGKLRLSAFSVCFSFWVAKGEFANYNVRKVGHFTRTNFGYLWADKEIDSQPLPFGEHCHSKY